jgi:shikimate kinase
MIKFPSTISLIGMAGAGKTSVGKALAERINYKFIDTDKVIEDTHKSSLQELLERYGYLKLREIEEKEVLSLSIDGSIISTGGSVVYGSEAMNFLNENSTIAYLEMSLEQIHKRNINFSNRGFAKHPDQSIEEVFYERTELYKKYANLTVSNNAEIEDCVDLIIDRLNQ